MWVCQKTEDWLGCPLLVDGSVCVGGGPLIKLFVMGPGVPIVRNQAV